MAFWTKCYTLGLRAFLPAFTLFISWLRGVKYATLVQQKIAFEIVGKNSE